MLLYESYTLEELHKLVETDKKEAEEKLKKEEEEV